ncbi:AAA family ATPase [Chondromyces crocatus]|uniref:AAA+ ATPase domain-containing protein n=1 Tax=Chondromyces crocatus TaxID=52 RepID=A0A0K1EFH7_CHOCO|nr:AAA family ATPase [Chondromyces crocatus]AKT39615.1 uncharacterized protein CMC5_037640 [Chondromyces crocatus]
MSSESVTGDIGASAAEGDDPTLVTAKQIAERLVPTLINGIRAFEQKPLVTFDWEVQGRGKQSTSVYLKEVKNPRRGSGTVNFVLAWRPSSGKEVEVPVSVALNSVAQNRPAVSIRIVAFETNRHLTLARGEAILKLDRGEKIPTTYPYPTSATGVERVGQVWFPRHHADENTASRETGFVGGTRSSALEPYWPSFHEEDGWIVDIPPLPPPAGEAGGGREVVEAWGKFVLAAVVWAVLVQPFQQSGAAGGAATADPVAYGLPAVANYWPLRAVNLDPNKVYAELSKSLLLPWHLVAAACASLNAGKHVIFTGPPGCGKSKLAIALARMVRNAEPVIATASPAWTAGDLVGRYLPRRDGNGLEFKPGFFLRAVEANRCLVIDEFNRASIDQCFGELFAVFAGDPVELPFEQVVEVTEVPEPVAAVPEAGSEALGADTANGAEARVEAKVAVRRKERFANVRILPATYSKKLGFRLEEEGIGYRDYKVSPEFRLVGTMNDADRAQLHQLSFALLRRFDIIRVEAPSPDRVREFITEQSGKVVEAVGDSAYQFDGQTMKDLIQRLRPEYLDPLFANGNVKPAASGQPFGDLVAERAVGLATVEDILRFVAEGLRCPGDGEKVASGGIKEAGIAAAASYLAMGLVLSVFPQLDALDDERRWAAIEHIVAVFHRDGKGAPFVYIESKKDEKSGRVSYQLVKPSARTFRPKDIDGNNEISTAEYLIGELSLQYKDIAEETWNGLILRARPS